MPMLSGNQSPRRKKKGRKNKSPLKGELPKGLPSLVDTADLTVTDRGSKKGSKSQVAH